SSRMTAPTYSAFFFGTYDTVSGKVVRTFFAKGIAILFASPGVKSDSWMIAGTPRSLAARTAGTDTNPPLENNTSGLHLPMMRQASNVPFNTLNGSLRFSVDI